MTTAVVVPAEAIFAFLKARGFTLRPNTYRMRRSQEVVYERPHAADPRYRVLVYTSVREGSSAARSVGTDAIRVCAIFNDGATSRGICKLPIVKRTGTVEGVLARMLERMREAYARCSAARPRTRARMPAAAPEAPSLATESTDLTALTRANVERVRAYAAHCDAVQEKHHPGSILASSIVFGSTDEENDDEP